MLNTALSCLLAGLLAIYFYIRVKTQKMRTFSENIPGPRTNPILGNLLDFGLNSDSYWYVVESLAATYGYIYRIWTGTKLAVGVWNPDYVEVLLTSTKEIRKGFGYEFLVPWLGNGLLTSEGQHWHSHRKLLTPAFHFKILEQFVEVFNRNGRIFVENLSKHVNGPEFDAKPYVKLCTLDNISETAMGVRLNSQLGENSGYVEAVHSIGEIFVRRLLRPWMHSDFIFSLLPDGRQQRKDLSVLHSLTESIIKKRKEELRKSKVHSEDTTEENFGTKRRLALLDLLLRTSEDGVTLTDKEIQEEVDTFMFEGHDTTASAISFTIWILSKHPDVQDKIVAEMKEIFGDSDRNPTYQDLHTMKYLEMVIKETLRLYPSVPLLSRELQNNMTFGDYTVPAGAVVMPHPYLMMRCADIYPEPEKFDPDRFLPENCVKRHPFSYIPFSAGPRNCIGQKFAVLEIKSTVSLLLRKFRIIESDSKEEPRFAVGLVLSTLKPMKLKLVDRNSVY